MVEACSQKDVDIQESGMVNVEKKTRLKALDGDDSTTKESIGESKVYYTNSGENNESNEETTTKTI